MKIEPFEFPDELYYTPEHIWARAEGDLVTIGLSQFGQELAGRIAYVEAPRTGRALGKGATFMSLAYGQLDGRV